LRTYNVLRDSALRLTERDPTPAAGLLGPEVDARLDWKDGLAKYHRDEAWRTGVIAHFDDSLRRIVRTAADSRVPLVLVSPVSNLEYPPFKSEHRADLTPAGGPVRCARDPGRELGGTDLPRSLRLLEEAAAIDNSMPWSTMHRPVPARTRCGR
jgi:hypothetical protein